MATSWGFDSNRSAGNLLSGGLIAIGSPSAAGYLSSYESRMAQEQAMQQQHDWQVAENEKDRQFQRDFWREQYEAANDFSYLAAQLRAAGINPSAYFGRTDASPTSPVGSSPSRSVSPSGFAGSAYGGAGASAFTSLSQIIEAASKIRTTNLAEERQKAILQAEVNKLLAEASNQSSNAEFIDTQNQIKKLLGFTKESYEIIKLNNEAYAASARGDYDKAAELNQKAMARVNDVEARTKEELKPILIANQEKLGKVYESERDKNVAQASQARAAAHRETSQSAYLDSLTATNDALRDGSIRAQNLANDINEVTAYISKRDRVLYEATYQDKLSALVASLERERLINKEMAEKIRKMQTDNDWNGVEHALGAVSTAVGSLSGLGRLELDQWSTSQRLQVQRMAVENMRKPSSIVRENYNSRGNLVGSSYEEFHY